MLPRPPDLLQVVVLAADPHALLDRRRPFVAPRLEAEEDVLELIHPGVGEEEGRIVLGQERRARERSCGPCAAKKSRKVRRIVLGDHGSFVSSGGGVRLPAVRLIFFSISSMARSVVDWMPWTRSRKLSGLRRIAEPLLEGDEPVLEQMRGRTGRRSASRIAKRRRRWRRGSGRPCPGPGCRSWM